MKKRDLYIVRGKDKEKGRERDNKKEWDNIYMIYVGYITFILYEVVTWGRFG